MGAEEEEIPILSTITESESSSWTFRVMGSELKHATLVARALHWPGAFSVTKQQHVVNIYLGHGLKYLPRLYTPPPPPRMCVEWRGKLVEAEDISTKPEEPANPDDNPANPDGDANADNADWDDDGQ
eukprot:TRINITY_DN1048_c0_g1_i3.p2 TRINITY_DN1048_c0_g1~~TRINITY_DN1048_c0_g1_i3.p2  ORF type:complete len:135 (-),score=54.17 TRINITY_DN1048_c0_g1_i3:42-422(-)